MVSIIATDYQAEFELNKDAKQSNNPVIKLIEKEVPKWIETNVLLDNNQSYKIKGSAGNGKMNFIPWIAFLIEFHANHFLDCYFHCPFFKPPTFIYK